LALAVYTGDQPMVELLLYRGAAVNPPVLRHARRSRREEARDHAESSLGYVAQADTGDAVVD
jgi:hypothetical protein